MSTYSFAHLSNSRLLGKLAELVAQDWSTTAVLVACIAEVDERRLYLPAAYPSMYSYCVHELHLSEDSAYRRITAARAARQYPVFFEALADGRLHLSAVSMLAPYLKPENAAELLRMATHKSKSELEELIAQRFPRSELLPMLLAIPAGSCPGDELVPGRVESNASSGDQLVPGRVETAAARSSVTSLAPQRFALQISIGQSARDKLHYAQELLGHQVPSGDLGVVIEHALDALIQKLEQRKFAASRRPQTKRRPTKSPRHVPAHVKREVHERDGGQCTFVSEAGKRCPSRTRLEFDHADPVARGGEATVDNLQLRCAAHNQFTAECTFGAEFMENKREEARRAAELRKARKAQESRAAAEDDDRDVKPWLRQLGYNAREASAAAEFCAGLPEASLEQRLRVALSYFHPRGTTRTPAGEMAHVPAAPH